MKWQIKVVKLALMGRLPFGSHLRKLKRKLFGYKPDISNIRTTIRNLEQMEMALHGTGRSFNSATVLEIGTGWFPVIPIALTARGAKRVTMTDLTPHLDSATLIAAAALFEKYGSTAELGKNRIDVSDLPLTYLAPYNANQVADCSIDVVTSRTVLEHIAPEEIIKLLLNLKNKLTNDGIMIHLVDHSDHLEHTDKTISKINFLTWSNRKHAIVNWMTKEGENRLRHHEYQSIFERAGYKVLQEISEVHEPTLSIAKQLPLVERFADMCAQDLATLCSIYILAPIQGNQNLPEEPVAGRTQKLD